MDKRFIQQLGIDVPIICGPMYPCSNPELVAAVSAAGGLGVVQPVSLTYVYGYEFRAGIRHIKQLTDKPIGMNALIEKSSKRYLDKMREWLDIALEEDVRFFITSLGKPDWVVQRVHAAGGLVYHDATERKWAQKGLDCGVDGLIAVNNRAGGHAGPKSAEALVAELGDLGVPLICAGGVGDEKTFGILLSQGYAGVQMGTRFIASMECAASQAYKQAIVDALESDVVLSERITGVPVSIIKTQYVESVGLKAGPVARLLLRQQKTKHFMRTLYTLRSAWQLKRSSLDESGEKDFWQAGKSVQGIERIEKVSDIIRRFAAMI